MNIDVLAFMVLGSILGSLAMVSVLMRNEDMKIAIAIAALIAVNLPIVFLVGAALESMTLIELAQRMTASREAIAAFSLILVVPLFVTARLVAAIWRARKLPIRVSISA